MKMIFKKFQRYEIIKLLGFLEGIRSSSSVLDREGGERLKLTEVIRAS